MINCFVDNPNKVCFWFSPKCGCTFVRKLYCYYTGSFANPAKFSSIIENYTYYIHILFTRDPYKRIISGFLDCYVQNEKYPDFMHNLTFSTFLNDLETNDFENVDGIHFQKQLSDFYSEEVKFDKIYDIENIDYTYLDSLFQLKVNPQILKAFRISGHHIKYDPKLILPNVSNIKTEDLRKLSAYPARETFLIPENKEKIYQYYKDDIEFFDGHGITY